jgi:CRP-like cAMP-binding protein
VYGDGEFIRRLGRGDSFGEIALVEEVPRTTSVIAHTELSLYAISRQQFVPAVTGYTDSARQAEVVVAGHLAAFAPRAVTV